MTDKPKRKRGRESHYTPEMGRKICTEISQGKSLRKTCTLFKLNKQTVLYWLATNDEFAAHYARAREEQADHYADEISDIADRTMAKKLDPNAARVAIDGLKWVASKLKPKKYGDKLTIDGDMTMRLSEAALDERLSRLTAKGLPALTHDGRDRDDH